LAPVSALVTVQELVKVPATARASGPVMVRVMA
jgi:hypothetical protein